MSIAQTAQAALARSHRLPAQPAEVIDRSSTITFTFAGKAYTAHPGDTIASALAAAGVRVFSRSFKYHRPRGLLCCAGHCPNCLVQIGDEPNVRACHTLVKAGMEVRPQNVFPSLDADVMSLTQLGSAFLPVGFYYKTFIHPKAAWPLYEKVLRNAAGLGEVHPDTQREPHRKQFQHTDVAVIGGGPAGLSAALAAAEHGAQVMVFDENLALGGHLRYSRSPAPLLPLLKAVDEQPNITSCTNTAVLGWYLDNWLSAVQGNLLFKIRAKTVVVATGAYETPLVFANNDLPGVMLGSAVQRLLHLYSVVPGQRAVIVTANDDGWAVAADLLAAGTQVEAIVDERKREACTSLHLEKLSASIPVFWERTIAEANGPGSVSRAAIARINAQGEVDESSVQKLACDLIVTSLGWTAAADLAYQAGAKAIWDEARSEILPANLPESLYAVGRAAGTQNVDLQMAEGRLAGLSASAFAGHGNAPSADEQSSLAQRKATEPRRTSARILASGHKKCIVCFCEDVTDKDIETSIAEGYNSMELLKRYATVTMGPCQGKMCAVNAIHLCARGNGWSVQETGATTFRQPTTPVSLGALAGQHMEPAQVTPVHQWHKDRGAKMMLAGTWIRPLHYGDPTAEVKAVRERVGLIDVSTLGKLRFTGPGVPALLDKLYINTMDNLHPGRVRYGVMCNDEAVVLDDGVSARLSENEWYTTTTTSGASAMYEYIQWWMQSGWGEGIHLTDVTESYAAFNLAGPKSRALLQKVTLLDVSNAAFPYLCVRVADVVGVPCRLMRIGFTGELSYEIHCPSGYALHLWEALMEAGKEFDIMPFGVEAQRVLRLEKAHIIVSQDTDATTDPLAANLGWAVKLDKPDFLGKRSLVRISAVAPKQKLVGFTMAKPTLVPDEGVQCVQLEANGKPGIIGYVTSSRFSPTLNRAIGLCWLPAGLAAQNGAAFTIRLTDGAAFEEARVHHGPFYDPRGERLRM
jgi:sarcosine oxidase, subunit alpha